jgi:aminopeptidase N
MNAGSGKNLNWFWKKWFFDNGEPDLAITSVSNKLKSYNIVITSKGTKPVPIDLTITYADKSVSKIHRSIKVWEKGNSTVNITIPTTQKIIKVELGSTYSVDSNKKDNVFELK